MSDSESDDKNKEIMLPSVRFVFILICMGVRSGVCIMGICVSTCAWSCMWAPA